MPGLLGRTGGPLQNAAAGYGAPRVGDARPREHAGTGRVSAPARPPFHRAGGQWKAHRVPPPACQWYAIHSLPARGSPPDHIATGYWPGPAALTAAQSSARLDTP